MQNLPPKPQAPVDYDCCGGGCADCDLRRYQLALSEWMRLATMASSTEGEQPADPANTQASKT